MSSVLEDIPTELQPAADAALAWINRDRGTHFRLTGLVDVAGATRVPAAESLELGLMLCDGDLCERRQVRVSGGPDGFEVSAVDEGSSSIPAHLDPPAGVRRDWLERQVGKHEFVLLLFYRGLW